MHSNERSSIINRVSVVSILTNGTLSVIKLIAGVFAYSQALISDGVDSLADVLMTLIVLAGVNMGKKSKDANHPYGHEKIESMAAILLSSVLLVTAGGIAFKGVNSINHIIAGGEVETPKLYALIVAAVSIASKELLYRYAKKAAKKTNSSALMADAWNFRTDAIASVGSFLGVGGAIVGIPLLDPIASLFIAVLIVRVAVKIGITAINEVTDHAADDATQQMIYDTIAMVKGVWYIDELRTRLHGSRLCVDVDIAVDGQISVEQAHGIADQVSEAVYACSLGVKQCMVHVNPYKPEGDEQ